MATLALATLASAAAASGVPAEDAKPAPAPASPRPAEQGRVLSAAELRAAARPTDPWSFLRGVPGVLLDRVDVGGTGTGLQPLVVARGDGGAGTAWSLDGFDVGDPAALGASTLFLDTGLLERLEIASQTADTAVRTPGLQIHMTLPAPGPVWEGGAHAALAGPAGDNRPPVLAGRALLRDELRQAQELRADAGGPIRGDRLFAWLGASRQAQSRDVSDGHRDRLAVTTFAARVRARAAGGSFDLLALRGEKIHQDRAPVRGAAPEALWRQSGPTHLVGITVVRGVWQVRAGKLDSGFRLEPRGGNSAPWEDSSGVFRGSYQRFETERPRLQARLHAAPRVRAAGREHALSLGIGWTRSTVATRTAWPGSQAVGFERDTVFFRAFDLTGFAVPTRGQHARSVQRHVFAYVEDETTVGPLRVVGGLRFDQQDGRGVSAAVSANPEFPLLLPAAATDGGAGRIRWRDVLPRAAISVGTAGGTTAALGYAAYGAALGAGDLTFDHPLRDVASLTYYWLDLDGDRAVDAGELDATRGRLGAFGLDPEDPGRAVSPHLVDPDLRAPRTHAVIASVARGGGPLHGALHGSWRRTTGLLWRPLRNLTLADYAIEGAARGTLFGDSYAVGYYVPANASRIVPGNGRRLTRRPDYVQDWWTVELTAQGRARSLRWRAWGAVHDWREWFSGTAGVQDPTPTEADPLDDGGLVATRAGGFGRDVFVNARWTAGAELHVPLPARLRFDGVLHARDGFPIPYVQAVSTSDPTGGGKNVLVAPALDAFRLPAVVLVDVRLAREFALGGGRATVAVDAFNVLGSGPVLQVARDVELPSLGRPRDVAHGRVLRLGLGWRR